MRKTQWRTADELFIAVKGGDKQAWNEFASMMFPEMRARARALVGASRPGLTFSGSDLVSQLWLRIMDGTAGMDPARMENAPQFLNVASDRMRNILIDNIRKREAHKRGIKQQLDEAEAEKLEAVPLFRVDVLIFDEALRKLEDEDEEAATAVARQYLLGFTIDEAAATMGLPRGTYRNATARGLRRLREILKS